MLASTVYRGANYFTDDSTFYINRVEEAIEPLRRYHSHDFLEICYVVSGSGYHVVDGRDYAVSRGSLFLIDYDVPHCFYRPAGSRPLTTYNILFTPGFLDESLRTFHEFRRLTLSYLFRNIGNGEPVRGSLHVPPAARRQFEELIDNMYGEYALRRTGSEAMIRGCLIQLIALMIRFADPCGAVLSGNAPAARRKRSDTIRASLEYLQTHYAETIDLSGLAAKSHLSRSQFAKVFKETTGKNVSQYAIDMRIDEARRLLLHTEKPAAEIARIVGFSDYKAFYRIFKQSAGSTPSRYRLTNNPSSSD